MARRSSIKASRFPAITITRHGLATKKVVYIAKANKSYKYPHGRSKVAYIGTTSVGIGRIAGSAAFRAQRLLRNRGVKHLEFYVVSCKPVRNVQTWRKLESALLLAFKYQYGRVPMANTAGKNRTWRDELRYFTERRLRSILTRFET